jgi:heptosyltransferase I
MSLVLPPSPRICLVMMSAVGDAVHALAVVTALKRHDPGCHVTWILQPGPASLVNGHPAVDEIVPFERSGGWRAFGELRRRMAGRRFDLVKLGFDRARARDLNWLVTTHRIPPHPPQHVQDQYFEFLHHLGVPSLPVEWGLGPWEHERAKQRELLASLDRPAASLVIGASDPRKEWLPERWAELCDVLADRFGLRPVLAGGRSPRELATERRIRELAHTEVVSTLGIPFRELVGVLDASALVVSLDTGPMHIAVALDVPTISLVGYTNPKRVGPYRRFRDLLVDAYGDPGEDYPVSIEKRPGRTERITVEEVVARVETWERRYRGAA